MKTIAISKAITKIRSFNGQFFSVRFTKKDGTIRYMTCRMGVSKGVNGRGTYSHTADTTRNNITVWDTAKFAFRAIPLDRVISLRHAGLTYQIV